MQRPFASVLIALVLSGLATFCVAQVVPDVLPEGRWIGALKMRTTPDVDQDGEWVQEVALVHCRGEVRLQRKQEDGTYTQGMQLTVVPFRRMFHLIFMRAEHLQPEGWVESQIWTLVDARPKTWTLSQSRAVFNHDMKPDDPWYTFRWHGFGTMEYDPEACPRTNMHEPKSDA